LENNSSLLML